MHLLRCLPLLFVLLSPMATPVAVAEGDFQIEMILFRQAGEPVIAATVAPDDWNAGSQSLSAGNARSTVLNEQAAKLIPANGYKILLHQAWTGRLEAASSALETLRPVWQALPRKLRQDPALLASYAEAGRRVDAAVPSLFNEQPKAKLEIKAVEPERSATTSVSASRMKVMTPLSGISAVARCRTGAVMTRAPFSV